MEILQTVADMIKIWESPVWCGQSVIYGDPAWPSYSVWLIV